MQGKRIFLGALAGIVLLLIWAPLGITFLIACMLVGLILWVIDPLGRLCPACGEEVPKGLTRCEGCGFDFRAATK